MAPRRSHCAGSRPSYIHAARIVIALNDAVSKPQPVVDSSYGNLSDRIDTVGLLPSIFLHFRLVSLGRPGPGSNAFERCFAIAQTTCAAVSCSIRSVPVPARVVAQLLTMFARDAAAGSEVARGCRCIHLCTNSRGTRVARWARLPCLKALAGLFNWPDGQNAPSLLCRMRDVLQALCAVASALLHLERAQP
jgi:hypothetical protein